MSGVPWNSLSKRLQDSIELQGPMYPLGLGADPMIPGSETDRACGCHERNNKWWLCGYHEGFQDADAIASGYTELLREQAIVDMGAQIVSLTAELAEAWRQVDIARGWAIEQRGERHLISAWPRKTAKTLWPAPWEEQP